MDDSDWKRQQAEAEARAAANNPFVAFRRFADDQMASAVSGVFSLFQQSPIRRQQMIEDYEAQLAKERSKARSKEQDESQRIIDMWDRATPVQPSSRNDWGQDHQSASGRHEGEDHDAAVSECPWMKVGRDIIAQESTRVADSPAQTGEGIHPTSSNSRNEAPDTAGTASIFDPTPEEKDETYECMVDYLAACANEPTPFEEKMCISTWLRLIRAYEVQKQEQTSKEHFRQKSQQHAAGHDELQHSCDTDAGQAPPSELDFYQQSLSESDIKEVTQSAATAAAPSTANKNNHTTASLTSSEKPSLLSALTTTETRILPDGTKTTNVVLKKRFSDGVEETSEQSYTENVRQPSLQQQQVSRPRTQDPAMLDKISDGPKKSVSQEAKKGWFWS